MSHDSEIDVDAELVALHEMRLAGLKAKWVEIFGAEPRSSSPEYLRRRLAWRVQELAHGGLSEAAKARLAELIARLPPLRPANARPTKRAGRDPRLPPPGSVLRREHGGKVHEVAVLEDCFEYDGRRFDNLSRVAEAITGTHWNPYRFFRLKVPAKETA